MREARGMEKERNHHYAADESAMAVVQQDINRTEQFVLVFKKISSFSRIWGMKEARGLEKEQW